MTQKKERWGIHVDGIKLSGFNSEKEADDYKEKNLKGKDAIVFQYQQSPEIIEKEGHYTPGHA